MTIFEIIRVIKKATGCENVHVTADAHEMKLKIVSPHGRNYNLVLTCEETEGKSDIFWTAIGDHIKSEIGITK